MMMLQPEGRPQGARNAVRREFRLAASIACVCSAACIGAIVLGLTRKSKLDWVKTTCNINAASMFAWTELVGDTREVRLMQTYHVTLTDKTGTRLNITTACQDFDEDTGACKVGLHACTHLSTMCVHGRSYDGRNVLQYM